MTAARIPVPATSFAACMVVMIAFLACVLPWAISSHPATHPILPHVLIGFPAITATGILVGLIGSLVVGNVLGATFAVSFNVWNAVAKWFRPGAAETGPARAASQSRWCGIPVRPWGLRDARLAGIRPCKRRCRKARQVHVTRQA